MSAGDDPPARYVVEGLDLHGRPHFWAAIVAAPDGGVCHVWSLNIEQAATFSDASDANMVARCARRDDRRETRVVRYP